jgi:hypothetical protein
MLSTGGRDSTPVRGVPYEPIAMLLPVEVSIEPSLSHFDTKSWCWVRSQPDYAKLSTEELGDDDDKLHETEALSYRKEDRIPFA